MAHPLVLRNLVTEYEALTALRAQDGGPQVRRRLEDVTYTLCVSTGTRDVDSALVAARLHLPGARPEDDSAAVLDDDDLAALGPAMAGTVRLDAEPAGPTVA